MTAEAVVKTFLDHQLANSDGQKNLTAADLDRLKATGVDLSKLSAGLTCRETSNHSILEGFPTVQVFSILPTEVFGHHVVQA